MQSLSRFRSVIKKNRIGKCLVRKNRLSALFQRTIITKDFPEDQGYPCTMFVLNWVELLFYEKLENQNQSVQLRI